MNYYYEYIDEFDNSGVVKKININELINACPILDRNQSNGNYLLFFSNNSIPKPNNPIKIDNTNLNSAGSWINNNTYYYYYSWTKISGPGINTNKNFTVYFDKLKCTY